MSNNALIMMTSTGGDQVFFSAQQVFAIETINPTECFIISSGGAKVKIRAPAGAVAMAVNGKLNKEPGF